MQVVHEAASSGVIERRVDYTVEDDVVPGIVWVPEAAPAPRPTILLGHGGTQEKRSPNVLALARRIVRRLGFNAVAIDAPDHGDRATDPGAMAALRARLEGQVGAGAGNDPMQLSAAESKAWVRRTEKGVRDWKAVVSEIEADPDVSDGRFGYWGLSMGTIIGLPFVAADRRVTAAVLGLAGLGDRPGVEEFELAARGLRIPVLFVCQWDDGLITRQLGVDLFDAIGSEEKTMHVNPGSNVMVPIFEVDAFEAFFARHLPQPAHLSELKETSR